MRFTLHKANLLFGLILVFTSFAFAQAEREKGIELYTQGNFSGAVESLQKAVESDNKDRDSRLFLGMALVGQKQLKDAVKEFKKADSLKSEEPVGDDKKIKFLVKPRVSYTDEARVNQTQGTIKLAVEFGADGKIKSIFPFQTLPNGLTANTIDAVSKIVFEPALKNGKPITKIEIVEYSFTIY